MSAFRDFPRCRTCGPGMVTYRDGRFSCVRCGKEAWISERLRNLRAASASAGWKVRA